jgi:hypothetical protein
VRGKEVLNVDIQFNEEQLINRVKKFLIKELKVEEINVSVIPNCNLGS